MLRVAFIDYVLEPDKPGRSGLSDVMWDMATALTDLGHEAHIIASYRTTNYPDQRITVHNFPEPPIGYRNLLGQFWILKRAADIAKKIKPDIIHTPEYISTAVLAQLGVKTPLVLTVPGNIFERIENGHEFEWFYVQVLKWAARKSARNCAAVIATSEDMKWWWEWTGSSAENTPLIPYGIDPHRFHPVPNAKAQLGLDPQRTLLLFAGRFAVEKGLDDLLDALALIRDVLARTNPHILLIGRGSQEQALREVIARDSLEPWVTVRDWVPQEQLRVWYSAADALLLPSHSEGFSRSIPEAMACGTPIIGSRITGTEDHVQDGRTGCLFPAKNPTALAEQLRTLLQQPARLETMGRWAEQYATAHFGWQQIAKQVVDEVYRPILNASKPRSTA